MIENCAIATMDGPGYDHSGAEYRTPLELLLVGGTPVVEDGELRTTDAAAAAHEARAAARRLAESAGGAG